MSDGNSGSHLSSTVVAAIATLAAIIGVANTLYVSPVANMVSELRDRDKLFDARQIANTEAVAELRQRNGTIKQEVGDLRKAWLLRNAQVDETLKRLQDQLDANGNNHYVLNERVAKQDEALRHYDMSVPPLAQRVAMVEAENKALEAQVRILVSLSRGLPTIQTDKGER